MPMLAAVQGISQIWGGISSQQAAQTEAGMQIQQGNIQAQQAQTNANIMAYNVRQYQGNQEEQYLGSGVTMQGSPIIQLAQTHMLGQMQVDAILQQGQAQQKLAYENAQQTENSGRNAFIAGILGAGSTVASDFLKTKTTGGANPQSINYGQAQQTYPSSDQWVGN
jgi:hypothetical protein